MGPWGGSRSKNFSGVSCFFHFFVRFSHMGLRNASGWQVRKIYHFSFSEASHGFVNWINWSILPRSSGQVLNCNATHQILGVYSPAQNTIQLFGIQKLFLCQYFLHCLVCLSERLQFSDERFCLTRKYLLSPAAPFILDANVFQSQYCYNISHLSTSPQDKYTKVGNTAYNN